MANMFHLPLAVFTVLVLQIVAFPPLLPMGHGGYGGYGGGKEEKEPLTLTCAVNFTDLLTAGGAIVNAIAVTIKPNSGGGGGKYFSFTGLQGNPGLHAKIDLFSAVGGPVVIAITERARPEAGCFEEDFGHFLNPESESEYGGGYAGGYAGGIGGGYAGGYAGGIGGGYGGGYGGGIGGGYGGGYGGGIGGGYGGGYGGGIGGGYGGGIGGGYGGGYGGGIGGGYGGGYGGSGLKGGSKGGDYGSGYGESLTDIPGVIAKATLVPGTRSSVNIDNLSDFDSLADLAGRGVIVCPASAVDSSYGDGKCQGGILSCCALHYDDGYQNLNGSS